jgi:hypothetical protein
MAAAGYTPTLHPTTETSITTDWSALLSSDISTLDLTSKVAHPDFDEA